MKNLLLLVVDCARAEKTVVDLPAASPATRRSAPLPFLDRLRERGTTWTSFCSVSSTTTPNFGTIFTGLTPRQHGIVEHSRHTLRGVPTLAEILRSRGWYTYAEVTGPLVPESGLDRGFDHYRCRPRTEYLHAGFDRRLAALLAELKEPWFLVVHVWEAHAPYQNPPPFHQPAAGATAYDRALAAADAGLARALGPLDLDRTSIVWCGDHGERLEADYALDRALGGRQSEVLACWQRFAAAHPPPIDYEAWFETARRELGEARARIYAHNVLGHGFHLTEDLIRIPLVIVDPERCEPGATRSELRSQLDLFATLLDLAGVEGADGREEPAAGTAPVGEGGTAARGPDRGEVPGPDGGRSILEEGAPEMIYIEANGSGGRAYASRCYLRGARSRRWKYWKIEGAHSPHGELWDLAEDPRETRDVAPDHADIVARMERFTDAWTAKCAEGTPAALAPEEERVLQETLRGLGYL